MSNSRCSFVFWDKRVGFVGSKSSLDQIARVFPPFSLSSRYEKKKEERKEERKKEKKEKNIMRRSDGQSFQPLSVHFPSPSLSPLSFPAFRQLAGSSCGNSTYCLLEFFAPVYFFAPSGIFPLPE